LLFDFFVSNILTSFFKSFTRMSNKWWIMEWSYFSWTSSTT